MWEKHNRNVNMFFGTHSESLLKCLIVYRRLRGQRRFNSLFKRQSDAINTCTLHRNEYELLLLPVAEVIYSK